MPENVNTSVLVVNRQKEAEDDPRETMVKVDHVTMCFNMASEQLNNLKEYAIKLAKRELFFEEFKALDDVSFEVKKGDVFGIMGTNGSGKSTILKIIAGVLDPTEGTSEVHGNIAPLIELGAGFDLDLSARENIYLNGALLGYSKEFIDNNFDDIVAFAEVEKFLDMPMKNYSSGMVARIAFAIATIIVPDILIVDEVLSVGDFMFQRKCEDRINELIEQHGVTVLIVSHSNEQIARMCNKAVWIEKGHVRLMGSAPEVCRIYGALGGRVGDSAVEQEIFSALVDSATTVMPRGLAETISGENANAVCTKMVMQAWKEDNPSVVALACDNTHSNSVVANALAACYDAPVLPVGKQMLPESVDTYLYHVQPATILVFDSDGCMAEALDQIKELPWNPEVKVFLGSGIHSDFSLSVYEYGKEQGFWGREASLVDFDDNPVALACQPYLYAQRSPMIFLPRSTDPTSAFEAFDRAIQDLDVDRLILWGSQVKTKYDSFPCLLNRAEKDQASGGLVFVGGENDGSEFVQIAQFTDLPHEIVCLAAKSYWPDLQSCGCCVARDHATLLVIDETFLESIQNAFDYLSANRDDIKRLVFIGEDLARSGLDPNVFCYKLLGKQEQVESATSE